MQEEFLRNSKFLQQIFNFQFLFNPSNSLITIRYPTLGKWKGDPSFFFSTTMLNTTGNKMK
jgi:hypothetical protein